MDPWIGWGEDGEWGKEEVRDWSDGETIMLLIQKKGETLVEDLGNNLELRKKVVYGWRWKKRMWTEWLLGNPNWAQDWTAPESWLPGEKVWFEGQDTWQEKIRRWNEQNRVRYQE
jgi:hypothetical protein